MGGFLNNACIATVALVKSTTMVNIKPARKRRTNSEATRQADALRRVLATYDVSQVALAKKAGVNKNTLTNILKNGATTTTVLELLTRGINKMRRKKGRLPMDVAEWLATAEQADILRRTTAAQMDVLRRTVHPEEPEPFDEAVRRILPDATKLMFAELAAGVPLDQALERILPRLRKEAK